MKNDRFIRQQALELNPKLGLKLDIKLGEFHCPVGSSPALPAADFSSQSAFCRTAIGGIANER